MKTIWVLFFVLFVTSCSTHPKWTINNIQLKDIEKYIDKANNIRYLRIYGSKDTITRIPKIITKFKNIEHLYISNVKIELTDELFSLPNVIELVIHNSDIVNPELLESSVSKFTKLESIELKDQNINFSSIINQNIKYLDIKKVNFQKKCLIQFQHADYIFLDSLNIDSLSFSAEKVDYIILNKVSCNKPVEIFKDNSTNVPIVYFRSIKPEYITNLLNVFIKPEYKVVGFEITDTPIDTLPVQVFNNYLLNYVGLFNTNIETIQPEFLKLENLELLTILSKLNKLPLFLNNMESLKKVKVLPSIYRKTSINDFNFKIETDYR